MFVKTAVEQRYIDINSISALSSFSDALYAHIHRGILKGCKSIVFVCIGTDRSTGDSLGPLVGHKIYNLNKKNVFVLGNLENPVHAKNLDSVMKMVGESYHKPFIIAVDACLGRMEHVGYITVGDGPIKPGSGVNKNLAPVGDMHVTGIVNFGGFMDFLVLQNTRLSIVMKMADLVSMGIRYVIWKLDGNPEVSSVFLNERDI